MWNRRPYFIMVSSSKDSSQRCILVILIKAIEDSERSLIRYLTNDNETTVEDKDRCLRAKRVEFGEPYGSGDIVDS